MPDDPALPNPPAKARNCCRCGVPQTDENSPRKSRNPKYFDSWCRECHRIHSRARHAENPEKYRAKWRKFQPKGSGYHLLRFYGITAVDRERMRLEQGNKCAVCKQEFVKIPCVDHCHSTKKVRGLLCHRCNSCLAFVENSERLQSALDYLKRTS